jgi:hypothetical protein
MSEVSRRTRRLAFAAIAALGAAGVAAAQTPMPPAPPYLGKFSAATAWGFEPKLTSGLPGDAFVPMKEALEKNGQFPQVQRLFDLWSWQAFLAVVAAASPAATRNLTALQRPGVPAAPQAAAAKTGRALFNVSAVGELIHGQAAKPPTGGKISETDQAFSGPLFDQNGNPTFYEILLDPNEVKYLCTNQLYSIAGQIAFSTDPNNKVQFPPGQWQTDGSGAYELKLAWKVLDPTKDKADRFFHQPAQVLIDGNWVPKEVGLVGMHIAHKSQSSPQWIWSTFEQIDNLATDPIADPGVNPSYFNPGCPTCPVNIQPSGNNPVQVLRMIPIPPDKQALNREAQAALRAQKSVWQYYQLIDTQWPTNPASPPTSTGDSNLPMAITNKSGGEPTPVYLTNATMETYFQTGNQNAANLEEGNVPPSTIQAFGTESCTGCHSSAGVAISGTPQKPVYGKQLSGDFSWLLKMKAQ